MRKIFLVCFLAIISVSLCFSQELIDKLPQDQKVIVGKLDNGMTYYIRENKVPEKRAEFTLVVNAGAVLEDDDQQGLAHFCEHMAFNGTKNFPKHELINYMESIGMKFGAEVNAYTSFDETVYGITVPTDNEEFVDKGLLVLHDWASEISFEDQEIKDESGVIHEEWRMSQGASLRMQQKMLDAIFNGSKYAKRVPIGLMEIVDNCSPDVIKRFYKDWYRTDLMAVVIVGDFDGKVIENKIKDLFGKIKESDKKRERVYESIPDNKEPIIAVASDKEASGSQIMMLYKHPRKAEVTVADYREGLIENLISTMLSNRLSELTQTENPPFAMAVTAIEDFIGPLKAFMSVGMMQNNDYKRCLESIVLENNRMDQHGFTQTELDRVKKAFYKQFESAYNEREKEKSSSYVREYQSHFLFPHTPFPGIEYEFNIIKKHLDGITLQEVNDIAKKQVTEENLVIVVMMPEKEGVIVPTEEDVLKVYQESSKQKTEAYVDKTSDKPFIEKMPTKGKVAKVKKDKLLGSETWTLKNGITVVLKQTDYKDDEILFYAESWGGSSLISDKDYISCQIACDVANESGMGNYDKTEFDKYMSEKNARINLSINDVNDVISGQSTVADFETLLQLIYVQFTNPRISESAFKSYINKTKALLENNALSPESVWQDSISWLFGNRHFRSRALTPAVLDEAKYARVKNIFENRFSDPKNFTFYFVGNIDLKKAKPLIEQYIASLEGVERTETYKDLGIRPPKGKIEKPVLKGQDAKCMEICLFHGESEYNMINNLHLDALCEILTTKLLEEIREKESGVYSIGAYPSFSKEPYSRYVVQIFYSCDPAREKELFSKIMAIIDNLQKGNMTDSDIEKTIEKLKREYETNSRENRTWRNTLRSVQRGDITAENYINYLTILKEQINIENMTKAARNFLKADNYLKVYLLPEK